MARYSYHASHEQFSPRQLVALSRLAESYRFDGVFCSDHLQPWASVQGQAGHAWAWMGAALQATNHISFSTITAPGGWRYHPVMLAQSIATLCDLFPNRLPWIALGSGEALNEAPLGVEWPSKEERQQRLLEGASMVRRLLQGEQVSSDGLIRAHDARIWGDSREVPKLFAAAMTEDTARWAGSWADGLLTLGRNLDLLARIVDAFWQGGGVGKPVHVKLDTCLGPTIEAALREAHAQWRFACIDLDSHHELPSPEAFEFASKSLQPADMARHVLAWSTPETVLEHVWACLQMGVDAVDFHHVGRNQQLFIQRVGTDVIPALRLRERKRNLL